jgi:hypothetical protein
MSKKFKFELEGMMFNLGIKFLNRVDWNGNPLKKPVINMNHVATANVVKQYVKKKYPNVVVSSSSSSFSMGNSVSIYISDEYGREVDNSIISDVQAFGSQFVYGKFNGMIDMYEYSGKDVKSDNGTDIKSGVKYLSVNNGPKHASLPDVIRMLVDMTTTENYVFGKLNITEAIEKAKSFGATENNINKALQLI